MGLFGKPSVARDEAWEQVCRLEDELVGRRPARPREGPAVPPFQRVVVAVDGQPGTDEALQWAARLGQAGATVWLASVGVSGHDHLAGEMFLGQSASPEEVLRAAQARMAALGGAAPPRCCTGRPRSPWPRSPRRRGRT